MKRYLFVMGIVCLIVLSFMSVFYILHNIDKHNDLEKENIIISKNAESSLNNLNSIYINSRRGDKSFSKCNFNNKKEIFRL